MPTGCARLQVTLKFGADSVIVAKDLKVCAVETSAQLFTVLNVVKRSDSAACVHNAVIVSQEAGPVL